MHTTQETIVESLASSAGRSIDEINGIIRGVKLIGFESRNGRTYSPDVLRKAVSLYEGAKVNVDHPESGRANAPRSVADRIGVVRNARFVEGTGVVGDFHFNPRHRLAPQIAWDAKHNPSAVGFSHNATLSIGPSLAGKRAVESIVGIRSVDLVADPATTDGIFESVQGDAQEQEQPADWLRKITGMSSQASRDAQRKAAREASDTALRRIRRRTFVVR